MPGPRESFLSSKVPNIHVLGDAAIAADMPKSAFSASSQAKVVAADILAALTKAGKDRAALPQHLLVAAGADDSVKIGADYTPQGSTLVASPALVSQPGEPAELRRQNYQESVAWYAGVTAEMFAKTGLPPSESKAG